MGHVWTPAQGNRELSLWEYVQQKRIFHVFRSHQQTDDSSGCHWSRENRGHSSYLAGMDVMAPWELTKDCCWTREHSTRFPFRYKISHIKSSTCAVLAEADALSAKKRDEWLSWVNYVTVDSDSFHTGLQWNSLKTTGHSEVWATWAHSICSLYEYRLECHTQYNWPFVRNLHIL